MENRYEDFIDELKKDSEDSDELSLKRTVEDLKERLELLEAKKEIITFRASAVKDQKLGRVHAHMNQGIQNWVESI